MISHDYLMFLQRLVETGNTYLVIEHNLDVIKTADYIIDLGPEGGDKGGRLWLLGHQKKLLQTKDSYTGKYLKPVLERDRKRMDDVVSKATEKKSTAVKS